MIQGLSLSRWFLGDNSDLESQPREEKYSVVMHYLLIECRVRVSILEIDSPRRIRPAQPQLIALRGLIPGFSALIV